MSESSNKTDNALASAIAGGKRPKLASALQELSVEGIMAERVRGVASSCSLTVLRDKRGWGRTRESPPACGGVAFWRRIR